LRIFDKWLKKLALHVVINHGQIAKPFPWKKIKAGFKLQVNLCKLKKGTQEIFIQKVNIIYDKWVIDSF
jgi:hypothetical protein